MQEQKTSVFSNALIWFGAAVSIAEILTGALIAPLGLAKGIASILLGHLIGCALLYFAGLIGANTGKSAMETVKASFGGRGALLFSSLNVLQLVGWTAVMIASGAAAANMIAGIGGWAWSLITGALIIVWILVGIKSLSKLNTVAMGALLLLTILLCTVIFKGGAGAAEGEMSFGAAVELSVAMPLSWLPLISDYTRYAREPKKATFASAAVYFAVSCWMYIIGMGAALYAGGSDIAQIMLSAGLGIAGLAIVVFSTVTTTFLDVYSAGVSCQSISARLKEKPAAIIVCAVGTLLAVFAPTAGFEGFLYLIGSVFAPMTAVLIADHFILKRDSSREGCDWLNMGIWLVGLILYRCFMRIETPVGSTLPVMLITGALCVIAGKFRKR